MKIEDIEVLINSAKTNLDRADAANLIHHQQTYLNAASANSLVAIAQLLLDQKKNPPRVIAEPSRSFHGGVFEIPYSRDGIKEGDLVLIKTEFVKDYPEKFHKLLQVGYVEYGVARVYDPYDPDTNMGIRLERIVDPNKD
jgi:hypothetical protein